jgi:U3 small nucleolar RNA-associated protein 14
MPSRKHANATGYAKRQARKLKPNHGLSSDVYEYAPEVLRRSKITLDLTQHEAEEYRVGVDGGNDEDREEFQARLIGASGENEGIESGDDEEIDSEAAFEESDEERFAGFFSSKVRL